jgi:Flp pilus assembly protein TadG
MDTKTKVEKDVQLNTKHKARSHSFFGRLRADQGTSVLEMALLTPVLLLLLLGIIEIGRYAELSILVANAARAGAQYGAQNLVTAADNSGIESAALSDGENIPGLSASTIAPQALCGCSGTPPSTCSVSPPTCTAPSHLLVYVQVNTTGTFTSLFRYPGIPSPITVNGMAQMRVAQ